MSPRPPMPSQPAEVSLTPACGGWHCSHLYYSIDRGRLAAMDSAARQKASDEVIAVLDPAGELAPLRMQTSIVSGHKADFALMILDTDPLKVDSVHQRLMNTSLGPALVPGYSFVSVTEISEYVMSVEQYGKRIVSEGDEEGSEAYQTKLDAYAKRLVHMNNQRLTPELPDWPATCFYPMNKKRKVGENWFTLSKEDRNKLMGEHARSGMAFAGKVKQLISVGLGFDDWEWGVTLWATNPDYLKEIVYRMRFDEASARYAEFGPFLTSYVCTAKEMLTHCGV